MCITPLYQVNNRYPILLDFVTLLPLKSYISRKNYDCESPDVLLYASFFKFDKRKEKI